MSFSCFFPFPENKEDIENSKQAWSLLVFTLTMAPHSRTLAWKIPWMEEPGRLQSMGRQESDMTERLHFHFSLSFIGEGNGNPLQCSCLENPRDSRAWWAAVHGVAQRRTRPHAVHGVAICSLQVSLLFSKPTCYYMNYYQHLSPP